MTREQERQPQTAGRLIETIVRMLEAKRPVLEESLERGRLKWRRLKNGEFKIELELNL